MYVLCLIVSSDSYTQIIYILLHTGTQREGWESRHNCEYFCAFAERSVSFDPGECKCEAEIDQTCLEEQAVRLGVSVFEAYATVCCVQKDKMTGVEMCGRFVSTKRCPATSLPILVDDENGCCVSTITEKMYMCEERKKKCVEATERALSLGHGDVIRERERHDTCGGDRKVLNIIHETCSTLKPRNGWQLCQSDTDEMSCELACGKHRLGFDPGECVCRSGGNPDVKCLERTFMTLQEGEGGGEVCCVSKDQGKSFLSIFESASETCISRPSALFCRPNEISLKEYDSRLKVCCDDESTPSCNDKDCYERALYSHMTKDKSCCVYEAQKKKSFFGTIFGDEKSTELRCVIETSGNDCTVRGCSIYLALPLFLSLSLSFTHTHKHTRSSRFARLTRYTRTLQILTT